MIPQNQSDTLHGRFVIDKLALPRMNARRTGVLSLLCAVWIATGLLIANCAAGLRGEYYDNSNFTTLKLARTDPTVNFNWGTGSPDPSVGPDTFSIRWSGSVESLYSEAYTFHVTPDDGVRVWIDGRLIVDSWKVQGPTEYRNVAFLTAGVKHNIVVDYYEEGGGASAKLEWSSWTQARQVIPDARLFPYQTWLSADIGSVGVAGSTVHNTGTGQLTIRGSGADIWDPSDSFRYAFQTLTGDGEMIVRLTSADAAYAWAKMGIMIREGLVNDCRHATMTWVPAQGASFQWRGIAGANSSYTPYVSTSLPVWVRMTRQNHSLIGFTSSDGVNWTQRGSINLPMGREVHIGMPVCSKSNSALTTSVFDNARLIPKAGNTTWVGERVVNGNGTINWTEWKHVANNYDRRDIVDYRFGPRYEDYHGTPEVLPTLWSPTTPNNSQPGAGGYFGGPESGVPNSIDWYAQSGNLTFTPNRTAPGPYTNGAVQANDGNLWLTSSSPYFIADMKVRWTRDFEQPYYTGQSLPDPATTEPATVAASGGKLPPPVVSVRTHGMTGVTGFLLFKNGIIGAGGTGNDGYGGSGQNLVRPFVKLAAGKVPTAGAVTPNNEWLFVTVWDTINLKAQLAVVAIKGVIVAQGDIPDSQRQWKWGFPNWPMISKMKVLGYVDLPFAAPMSIAVSCDHINGYGRGDTNNMFFNLDDQAERDRWYNDTNPWHWKRTPWAGYAVISSRAENRVCFVDLQGLFQYYRTMYFTSQSNYNQTKNEGDADNQWPYRFNVASQQTPVVVQTITITQPTAVAAGNGNFSYRARMDNNTIQYGQLNSPNFTMQQNAYVASMDGIVRKYKVGDLMTTGPGTTVGAPFGQFNVGRNPTILEWGHVTGANGEFLIPCRGDRAVYWVFQSGHVNAVLRDSRMNDIVCATGSINSRGGPYGTYDTQIITLQDFYGQKILNYRYRSDPNGNPKVGNPPGSATFEWSAESNLPGTPFSYTLAEVF